jgi:hypothetical protein
MAPTIQDCVTQARYCEWYAGKIDDDVTRKLLLAKAKAWAMLAAKKEIEVRASARAVA